MTPTDHEAARAELTRAMALHAADRIDEALAAAERSIALDVTYAEAHAYIGNTLVTRKRRFADGLAALERAVAFDPQGVGPTYTLGWCQEFVAQALMRGGHRGRSHQPLAATSDELFDAARDTMLRALTLADPDDAIVGDIEDVLDYISTATGIPWTEEERGRAAPRPR